MPHFSSEPWLYTYTSKVSLLKMLDITARDVPNPHKTLNTFHASLKTQEKHLNYKRNIWYGLHFIFQSYTLQPVLELFLMLKLWTEVLGGSSYGGGHFILFESTRCEQARIRAKMAISDFKRGAQTFKFDCVLSFVPWFRHFLQWGVRERLR